MRPAIEFTALAIAPSDLIVLKFPPHEVADQLVRKEGRAVLSSDFARSDTGALMPPMLRANGSLTKYVFLVRSRAVFEKRTPRMAAMRIAAVVACLYRRLHQAGTEKYTEN
jgi:hypothetical protein